jgi:hypothetical protein
MGTLYLYSSSFGDTTPNAVAQFRLHYGATTLIEGVTTIWSNTKDTASKINVYVDGGYVRIQNNYSLARSINCSFLGYDRR